MIGGVYAFSSRVNDLPSTLFGLDTTPGEVRNPLQQRLQELADLKLKDSDSDTITDFDELYVHKTSAYLADSDADGMADNVELAQGKDPICAEGNTCTTTRAASTTTATTNTNTTALPTNLSAAELRTQLASSGVSKSLLDQVTDQELLDTYASVAAESNATAVVSTNTTADPYADLLLNTNTPGVGAFQPQSVDQLQNLNVTEIRNLLKQGGASDADLEGIDDATLQQIYQDTLSSQLDLLDTTTGQTGNL